MRCNAGEAMAHNLQSTVPEREREINELLQKISLALLHVPIMQERMILMTIFHHVLWIFVPTLAIIGSH